MRLVFFGTPEFAVPSLAALHDASFDIAAVVTRPDRPRGRSRSTAAAPPVKRFAEQLGLPVWQPERPRGGEFLERVSAAGADLGVVVAYGHLLPAELLDMPRLGFVNVHASLLPRWRGAAPIQWAILAGDRETGVSIMRMEAGLDTGAVWSERRTAIGPADTAGSLTARLAALGAEALLDALPRITAGEPPTPQDDSGANRAAKVTRDLARIDWRQPAAIVARQIRAMDPSPGAWTTLRGDAVKLFAPATVSAPFAQSGDAIWRNGELRIAAGDDAVSVGTVQPAGRRRMSAAEWVRGTPLDGLHFE